MNHREICHQNGTVNTAKLMISTVSRPQKLAQTSQNASNVHMMTVPGPLAANHQNDHYEQRSQQCGGYITSGQSHMGFDQPAAKGVGDKSEDVSSNETCSIRAWEPSAQHRCSPAWDVASDINFLFRLMFVDVPNLCSHMLSI